MSPFKADVLPWLQVEEEVGHSEHKGVMFSERKASSRAENQQGHGTSGPQSPAPDSANNPGGLAGDLPSQPL